MVCELYLNKVVIKKCHTKKIIILICDLLMEGFGLRTS